MDLLKAEPERGGWAQGAYSTVISEHTDEKPVKAHLLPLPLHTVGTWCPRNLLGVEDVSRIAY